MKLTKKELDRLFDLSFRKEDFEERQKEILSLSKKYNVCCSEVEISYFFNRKY